MDDRSPRAFQSPAAVVVCALVLALLPGPALHASEYADNTLIARLDPGGNLDSLNEVWGTVPIDSISGQRIYLLLLTDPSLQDSMASSLDGTPGYSFCDYDYEGQSPEARRGVVVIAIGATGGDVEDQGAMARVRKDEAHAISTGNGALVAVLDTGFELNHPFLGGRFEVDYGADFVDNDSDPSEVRDGVDDDADGQTDEGAGHGTMVAGLVATIAPDASIIPFRVLDDEGRGTVFTVIKGLYRAAEMGARVINLSLGMRDNSEALKDAIDELSWMGAVVVAASGNDSVYSVQYPARYSKTIGVTATDSADVKADFANYASSIDVSAPGVGMLSTYLDDGYALGLGTSFSAPIITGTLALLLERFPSASPDSLRQWVMRGAVGIDSLPDNMPFAGKLGAGRIDCVGALLAASSATGVSSPPALHATRGPGDGAVISLLPTAPNPTAGPFLVRFALAREAIVRVRVFTVAGRAVGGSVLGTLPAGSHAVPIDPRDDSGRALTPGRYLYRVEAGGARGIGAFTIHP